MHASNAWQVENIRLSFFFDPQDRQHWLSLWEAIAKSSPESKTEKPALLTMVEEGEWDGRLLGVSVQHNRADVVLSAKLSEPTLPNAGSLGELVAQLSEAVSVLVAADRAPTVKRIGFGVVLLAPTETHEKGYERLAEFLPAIKVDPKSKDFFYQINRPINSEFRESVILNRISKWSVVIARYVSFEESGVSNIFSSIANRLELDVNSAEETPYTKNDPITSKEILELFSLGERIADKGDVP